MMKSDNSLWSKISFAKMVQWIRLAIKAMSRIIENTPILFLLFVVSIS